MLRSMCCVSVLQGSPCGERPHPHPPFSSAPLLSTLHLLIPSLVLLPSPSLLTPVLPSLLSRFSPLSSPVSSLSSAPIGLSSSSPPVASYLPIFGLQKKKHVYVCACMCVHIPVYVCVEVGGVEVIIHSCEQTHTREDIESLTDRVKHVASRTQWVDMLMLVSMPDCMQTERLLTMSIRPLCRLSEPRRAPYWHMKKIVLPTAERQIPWRQKTVGGV